MKTSVTKIQLLGIIIAFLGVIFVILKGETSNLGSLQFNYGDILVLIANVFFALHHVWTKKYAVNISSSNFTLLTSLCCLLGFLILTPFNGIEKITIHTYGFWVAVFGIGCLGTALAYSLWHKGVQVIGADQAGIYMNIVPLSTAVLAIFFNKNLHEYHLIGGLLIILGMLITRKKTFKSTVHKSLS